MQDFRRMLLALNYIDGTKNTYIPKLNCYGDNGERTLKELELLYIH